MGGFVIASIPAIAAVVAALIASFSARAARRHDTDAQRLRDLEQKVADKKYDTYKPMIDLLADMMDPRTVRQVAADEDRFHREVSKFSTWVSIYGSDEAVEKFHNLMQTLYIKEEELKAPIAITLKLYIEFVIAVRRDLGNPQTAISPIVILGMRITDIHQSQGVGGLDASLDVLCARHGWTPPWVDGSNG
ncbi:hypothetical protein ACWGNE_03575 [Streptomyces xiamenensis]